MTRVGVIGAGISGLTVVHELMKRDVDVVGFEAEPEPGGIMRSLEVDDHVLELGPQRLRYTAPIRTMIEELDLTDELRWGDDEQPLYVYVDGKLRAAPLSVRAAITTDLLSIRGKLRMLGEPLADPPRSGETVDSFLRRSFGDEAADRFLGPLYSGLYGTDPREMLVEYSLGRALETAGIDGSILLWVLRAVLRRRRPPRICTLESGLGRLSTALYEANREVIRLETPVERITESGSGYQIEHVDGRERVDEVVVTTPAPTAATLLEPVDPEAATALARLHYNQIGMVFLESDFEEPGIGTLVPHGESVPISGLTWNASFLGRDSLFTCYLDPVRYPALETASDAALASVAVEGFETITGHSASPIHVHRWDPGMPAYDTSWKTLDSIELPESVHLCTNFVERPGIPGRLAHAERVAARIEERTRST